MFCREFYYWCRTATSKIRYWRDRNAVHKELLQHLEDRCDAFLEQGHSPEEAQKMTLKAMGEPELLTDQLAQIHKPHWAYAMLATRTIAIVLAVICIIPFIGYISNLNIHHPDYEVWNPYDTPGHSRIFYAEPNIVCQSDGYRFRLKKVSLGRSFYTDSDTNSDAYFDELHLQIEVTNPLLWMPEQEAIYWFWAEDDRGYIYASQRSHVLQPEHEGGHIFCYGYRTGLATYLYDIRLMDMQEDAKWIKLNYDRSGRNITFFIDLREGGTS